MGLAGSLLGLLLAHPAYPVPAPAGGGQGKENEGHVELGPFGVWEQLGEREGQGIGGRAVALPVRLASGWPPAAQQHRHRGVHAGRAGWTLVPSSPSHCFRVGLGRPHVQPVSLLVEQLCPLLRGAIRRPLGLGAPMALRAPLLRLQGDGLAHTPKKSWRTICGRPVPGPASSRPGEDRAALLGHPPLLSPALASRWPRVLLPSPGDSHLPAFPPWGLHLGLLPTGGAEPCHALTRPARGHLLLLVSVAMAVVGVAPHGLLCLPPAHASCPQAGHQDSGQAPSVRVCVGVPNKVL